MPVPWNLTGSGRKYKEADVLVISIPKSGRTWLRVLLSRYLSLHFRIPFRIKGLHVGHRGVPAIAYSHDIWGYRNSRWVNRVRGKYVVLDRILKDRKLLVLHRDPRDVVVSLYFSEIKRLRRKAPCEIGEFIKDRRFGIRRIVEVMNHWARRFADHPASFWISYEGIHRDPLGALSQVLGFAGIDKVDRSFAEQAVAFASFENLQRIEASGTFPEGILQPIDASDPEAFKVREGKVGGYVKHFAERDIEYLNQELGLLEERYGYKVG
jgi:hypothetical protein